MLVAGFLLTGVLGPIAASAETVLLPRTKADHQADLRALEERYGAKHEGELRQQIEVQSAEVAREREARAEVPAPRVQITLEARSNGLFFFADRELTGPALEAELESLKALSRIDSVLLLESSSASIEASHLIELLRISRQFDVLALYQKGQEVLPVGSESALTAKAAGSTTETNTEPKP
jgi:hypothetical protein